MSVIERLDLFSLSLPRKCLYCKWGYPVLFGTDEFLDVFACGRHYVKNLTSKKLTLKLTDIHPNRGNKQSNVLYAPMIDAWETCDDFKPIKIGDRKFKVLDSFGYFDGMWGDDE